MDVYERVLLLSCLVVELGSQLSLPFEDFFLLEFVRIVLEDSLEDEDHGGVERAALCLEDELDVTQG